MECFSAKIELGGEKKKKDCEVWAARLMFDVAFLSPVWLIRGFCTFLLVYKWPFDTHTPAGAGHEPQSAQQYWRPNFNWHHIKMDTFHRVSWLKFIVLCQVSSFQSLVLVDDHHPGRVPTTADDVIWQHLRWGHQLVTYGKPLSI